MLPNEIWYIILEQYFEYNSYKILYLKQLNGDIKNMIEHIINMNDNKNMIKYNDNKLYTMMMSDIHWLYQLTLNNIFISYPDTLIIYEFKKNNNKVSLTRIMGCPDFYKKFNHLYKKNLYFDCENILDSFGSLYENNKMCEILNLFGSFIILYYSNLHDYIYINQHTYRDHISYKNPDLLPIKDFTRI